MGQQGTQNRQMLHSQWVVPQKCPYSSPNILICPSQLFAKTVRLDLLFNPSTPTVCVAACQMLQKTENNFILTSLILKCNAFCISSSTINHLVHLEQKQYSQLRAMLKVYNEPCFPSLSVMLSQEPLGGSGPMSLIKGETLQLFGECMRGENA